MLVLVRITLQIVYVTRENKNSEPYTVYKQRTRSRLTLVLRLQNSSSAVRHGVHNSRE